ncbi:MAG: type I-F CRISPR-associated protein Csy3 [Pseudomonadota bacterium]
MSNTTDNLILPSLLSFERKIETSDGLMFSGNWSDTELTGQPDRQQNNNKWKPVLITKRQNRSTQSAAGIDDTKKIEPNPVSSDSDDANLPIAQDTLKLSFTLRFIGNVGQAFACNAPTFSKAVKNKVTAYVGENGTGLEELAFRYAYNIANGRFLWRNRVGAEEIFISVKINGKKDPIEFNAYNFSLKDFSKNHDNDKLKILAKTIQKGLSGTEDDFVFLEVNAFVKLGKGQHIFPSQEMNMGEKKKVLFQLDKCAAMHNVKIGNAIRTIDNWYGDKMLIKVKEGKKDKAVSVPVDDKQPIAIEPYGAVTQHGRAYRHTEIDFYTLLLNWLNAEDEDSIDNSVKNYVIANLIRGGVFSQGGDK